MAKNVWVLLYQINYGWLQLPIKLYFAPVSKKIYNNSKIPAGNEGKGIPAVWSFPRNTITDDQLCWVEPDWMEYWEDGFWTTAIHEGRRDAYKGPQTYSTTNTNYAGVGPLGDGEWHTLTYLWTEDRIESYLDGNPSMVFTYGSGVAEPPVRQKVGESRNDQYFPLKWEPQTLIIGGSETAPLELDWIRVWQRPNGIDYAEK